MLGALALSAPAEAAITHTFTTNALGIQTDAGDAVVVGCDTGSTTVNGVPLASPAVPCADVQSMTITGDGAANTINLNAVTAASFTSLPGIFAGVAATLNGEGGNDVITGSPLTDTINGGGDDDTINGGAGDETINAGAGADTIGGDNGNDTITGGPGDDPALLGGGANDTLIWSPGDGSDPNVNGQGGDNHIQVNGADGVTDEFTIDGDGDGDGFNIDRVEPAAGAAQIHVTGPAKDVSISTGTGDDTIIGGAEVQALQGMQLVVATTSLDGGDGIDTITGTDTGDTITGGAGNDILSGSGGDDTAVWAAGDGDDSFSGGGGTDTAQLTGDGTNETFSFGPDVDGVDIDRTVPSAAHIEADTIERVNVSAGLGDDTVTGSTGVAALGVSSTLAGGSGNDTLTGTDGNDTLSGNTDNDALTGGDGDDSFVWNSGDDTDAFHGGPGSDAATVNGSAGADSYCVTPDGGDVDINESAGCPARIVDADAIESVSIGGGDGADTISAATVPASLGVALSVSGGNGDDIITGSDSGDMINGGAQTDTVNGAGGGDVLTLDPNSNLAPTDDYDGEGGEDTLIVTPESGVQTWTLQPVNNDPDPPVKFSLARTNVTMLAGTIEHLSIDLGSGNDNFTGMGSLAPVGLQTATILGDSGNDTITGTDLPDTINGGGSSVVGMVLGDTVHGGGGNDTLSPGAGSGTTTDTVSGDAGNDTVEVNGDTSDETIAIAPDGSTVDIDRDATTPATNAHVDAATLEALSVKGGDGMDTITGATGLAVLNLDISLAGGAQNDMITGTDDSDSLNGDAGNDSIMARDGVADQLDCGSESDTAQTDQLSLDSAANCETVDALAEAPVVTPTTPTTTTPATADPCPALRAQLKKATSKKKRKKLKKKLRQNGC